MVVIKSKVSGYCHGVNNTIQKAYQVLETAKQRGKNPYCIGQLIHNETVVDFFEKKGLKVISDENVEPGVALIRAHGISDSLKSRFYSRGFELVDSTCINIIETQGGIRRAIADGRTVIVVGIKGHAETNTLLGCGSEDKFLVSSTDDLASVYNSISDSTRVSVAVQTTFPQYLFDEISSSLSSHFSDIVFLNSLCLSCSARKSAALVLSMNCDAVFVVGGKHSSNTKELANWAERGNKPVFLVSGLEDFDSDFDKKISCFNTVGVCSGTSTPAFIVDDVCKHLESL